MFEAEPTQEEIDAMAKELGIEGKPPMEQFEAMMRYSDAFLAKAYEYLKEACPRESRKEFERRANEDPSTSGFKEFVETIMPQSITIESLAAHFKS